MKSFQSKQNVGCVEFSRLLFEPTNLTDVEKKFSTWAIVQDKKEFLVILESVIHFNDERMGNFL